MEIAKSKTQFQALIDCALELDGSYYLTYHRWARMDQLETAHPQLRRFMDLKSRYDPTGLFNSDWYRHYRDAHLSSRPGCKLGDAPAAQDGS